MANHNKREKIIPQTGDDRSFTADLLGSSERLIPVQLPERPVSTSRLHSTLAPPSLETFGDHLTSLNIRRAHSSSPGASSRRSRFDVYPPSPSSPVVSELSRHSDESILIVGDTFLAPTRLRIPPESAAHFTDAGALDNLQRSLSQISPPSTSHFTSISPRPSQNEHPFSMPSSPYHQARSSTKSTVPIIVAPQAISSLLVQPVPKNLSNSPSFLQDSPPDEPPSIARPRKKSLRSRRTKKRRDSTVSSESPSTTGSEQISEVVGSSSSNVDQPSTSSQTFSRKGPTNSLGLNPHAPVFEPGYKVQPRLPLPNALQPSTTNEPVQTTHATQPSLGYAELMLHPFYQQSLANIQQDLPHLRQWSSLFQHSGAPVMNPLFNYLQTQDLQGFAAMKIHSRQEGELFPTPLSPLGYNFGPAAYIPQTLANTQHAFPFQPHASSASFRVPYNDRAMESAAQRAFSIPVVNPSHSQSFEFLPSQSLDSLEIHDVPGIGMSNVPVPVSLPARREDTEQERRDVIRGRLVDRGKTSLTPVTERSEVSTQTLMTPVYPTREPVEEVTQGSHPVRRRKKKKHGRRSKRNEPTE